MNTKNASKSSQSGGISQQNPQKGQINGFFQDLSKSMSHPTVFTATALVLVALSSFALGRLSVLEQSREPIRIEYEDQTATVLNTGNSASGGVVASKNGSVYYFPWCAGAMKIAEANKVTFASESIAKDAGLRPAANCKGMGK